MPSSALSSSSLLYRHHRIVPITSADESRILEFLREHYYREEPLTIGSMPPEQDAADEQFTISQITHGTCLMAITDNKGNLSDDDDDDTDDDADKTNGKEQKIIGAVIAGPKEPNEAELCYEEAKRFVGTKWGRTLRFLADIEAASNVYQKYNVQHALHTHVLAVDGECRGAGLGAELMTALISRGRDLGYPLLTTDCTSEYSAKIMARLGFECVNVLRYVDYCDENGVQVFQPPPPHKQVETYAFRL